MQVSFLREQNAHGVFPSHFLFLSRQLLQARDGVPGAAVAGEFKIFDTLDPAGVAGAEFEELEVLEVL